MCIINNIKCEEVNPIRNAQKEVVCKAHFFFNYSTRAEAVNMLEAYQVAVEKLLTVIKKDKLRFAEEAASEDKAADTNNE